MRSEDIVLSSDGLSLAARVLWPGGADRAPALIVCHGFGSCKENHAAFAAQAAAQGWVVLSFDFRGHGASDGCVDSRTINDIGAALAWLREQPGIDPARIAVRGSSMGGYFAVHAARQWPELACCVAISPPDETGLQTILREAHDPATFYGRWRASGGDFPRVMGCDLSCWLESNDLYAAVADLAPRPLLLVGCPTDARAPAGVSEALYQAAHAPKTLWLADEGDPYPAAHDPQVGQRTLDWLARAG